MKMIPRGLERYGEFCSGPRPVLLAAWRHGLEVMNCFIIRVVLTFNGLVGYIVSLMIPAAPGVTKVAIYLQHLLLDLQFTF